MPEPGRAEQANFIHAQAQEATDREALFTSRDKRTSLDNLRRSIARIEAAGTIRDRTTAGPMPPASDIHADIAVPAPRPASFYEIAPASAADCSAAAGFALTIAGQMIKSLKRPVLWVAEDFALTEQGAPYAPGLAAYGIPVGDFILIRTRSRLDLWRVMEEAIKSRAFAAIIGEPAALAGRDLPALIRRLTINARANTACAMLLRPPAQAGFLAPSPLRFEVSARPADATEQPTPSVLARPLPAPPAWSVRYRGAHGALEGLDPERPFRAHLSRTELLDEVSRMMIKERSGAALPVHISHAA